VLVLCLDRRFDGRELLDDPLADAGVKAEYNRSSI
jgi:hypothetical protein